MRPKLRIDAVQSGILVAAVLITYSRIFHGGLLWDDATHLTRPHLQSLHGLWRIWSDLTATQQYYPMLHTAFWVERKLWADALFGYHITNVVLHTLSAWLVVLIVRRLSIPGAWLAGLLFALHPVCVESVAWIAEQKNTLSAAFYLSSALIYLHFDETRRRSHYFAALALFLLALLTKSVTATLPAALLLIFWWQRGRLTIKRDVIPLLPWLAIGAVSGFFTAWVERELVGAKGADFSLTLLERCLLAGRVIVFYLAKLIWPSNLTFIYPRWTIDGRSSPYLLAVILILATLVILSKRARGPLAGFLFFIGTLFPVLGFFNIYPFRFSYVADHFQYLASLGIIVPAASGLTRAVRAQKLIAALPIALAILSWRQTAMYRDAETLYRETIARNPDCWMAHLNLGAIYAATPGKLPDAISEYRAALNSKPDYAEAHYSLGSALMETAAGLPEAIPHLEEALRIQPDYLDAHINLALALANFPSRTPEAIAHLKEALRRNPNHAEAHLNLGSLLSRTGQLADAIAHYQAALRINPEYIAAHINLGNALSNADEAITHFTAALRLDPNSPEAHYSLGNALWKKGSPSAAIAEYQAALRRRPNYVEAHYNLGVALSTIPGRTSEAIHHLESALQLRPDLIPIQRVLDRLR